VPDRHLALGEEGRDLLGAATYEVEAEGRHAALHVADPVELDTFGKAGEETLSEGALVREDRLPAERAHVVHCRDEPRKQLVLARAELEAMPDRLVRRRSDLERAPRLEKVTLAERQAHVRAEVLVRRADQHVHVPGADVDRPMGCVVNGVGPGECAHRVRELDDAPDVRCGADGVRGHGKRDDTRALGEVRLEVGVVELEVGGHTGDANDDAEVVRELQPRRDVRVVVQLRHDDLVARAQGSGEGAREQEVERGHALPEGRLACVAAEEVACPPMRERDELVGAAARLVRRTDVRVRLAKVVRDRGDHLVGALRAPRAVEERKAPSERREARADGVDVEESGAHVTSVPLTIQRCLGLAVREFETKHPCSARATSSANAGGSGVGARSTSSLVSMSTNAYSPSSARFVTTPCALPTPFEFRPARRAE
jgi:hypothetical protein